MERLESVGVDAANGDLLEAFRSAGTELSRAKTVPDVADAGLRLALELTRSAVAFVAILDETGDTKRVFSRACTPADQMSEAEIERVFAAAVATGPVGPTPWTGTIGPATRPVIRSTCARTLEAGGEAFGMFGVASPTGYTAVQLQAFAVLAQHVAAAIGIARMHERRQEMIDTLVNLRADLDRSERQRLINEERARSAERMERAHEAAADALLAVSRHARTPHGLTDFYQRLTRSIAELVGAGKVLFWKRNDDGSLVPVPGGHGVDTEFSVGLAPVPCAPDRDDLASRIVFHDLMFRASRKDDSGDFLYVLDALNVDTAIAVPWRAGDHRLGLVAAYDSRRPDGFSREDAWVLQKAGLAAG
ncbi:MAG TPA: GAF domain-containing protein, partial [Candidatus Dormibacteraeota bacterium]|nr:GAF domain-containing protein [Candidatus Dormibacteraeota bacterium]